jgi:regulator of replication initiation timing
VVDGHLASGAVSGLAAAVADLPVTTASALVPTPALLSAAPDTAPADGSFVTPGLSPPPRLGAPKPKFETLSLVQSKKRKLNDLEQQLTDLQEKLHSVEEENQALKLELSSSKQAHREEQVQKKVVQQENKRLKLAAEQQEREHEQEVEQLQREHEQDVEQLQEQLMQEVEEGDNLQQRLTVALKAQDDAEEELRLIREEFMQQ